MATAPVRTKRSFASMSEDSIASSSLPHAGQSAVQKEATSSGTPVSHKTRASVMEGTSSIGSSARSTPRDTPTPATLPRPCRRNFKPDASIVLIGMRGTGKSTLAVIASIACRRRVVDIDDLFQDATGFSTARYRKQFGAANHNLRQEELLRAALRTHNNGAIIVCNGGSLERNGQALMQEFARTHPVIHVVRDLRSVHDYLGGIELSRLKDMLAITAPILRRCSNYEFYNISETTGNSTGAPVDEPAAPAFLTLKRAQRTFLKFLSLITSRENTNDPIGVSIPPLEPGYPLSDVATELRKYTCAVQVPLVDLLTPDIDIQCLELGCDAFEILVDPDQSQRDASVVDDISSCISKVRRSTVVPIIYHVLPAPTANTSRASYLEHVHHGLKLAPEFLTMDLSLEQATLMELVASRGITKMIGHLHADKPWDDPSWVAYYELAVRLGCAVVRFTQTAGCIDDDVPIQGLRSRISISTSQVPLVCYNTGRAGRRSVCFNRHLTPVIPKTSHSKPLDHHSQTSWLTAREVTQALYTSFTFDPMLIYIIGASLEYSVSPAMHNAAYDTCGMPHEFIRVQSSSLNSLQELVRKTNFGGSIVIQPFKIEVISLADSLSQHARAIGAVNTLIPVRHLKSDGSIPSDLELFQERNQSGPIQALYGDNTEWIGIRSCVRRGLSPANAVRPTTSGLIIGAGGMARAAVYALLQLGVQNIVIFNRTLAKAEKMVAHFTRLIQSSKATIVTPSVVRQDTHTMFHVLKSRDDPWPEDVRQPTIILSCIPADPIDDSPAAQFTLPDQWIKSSTGGVVMEIAYKTLNTPLMQQVQGEGPRLWTYMDGLDFLPEQAFAQFELFTGKRAPRRVMREEVLRAWRDEQGNADPEMIQRRLKAIDDQEP
ncbi:type I 3-dehydroquinase-domain-containing protein [Pyrenochaeta sp. MPI-SDFR-AT-0127]|nr:type I 3-dehydroquinase-domain-containing protein [Pyrenochaeta sp. MPI-SDFR-AT-0127]